MPLDTARFAFGIEHEVAFLKADGQFADSSNTPFAEFDRIIQELPLYPSDYPQLLVGDAKIRYKRWYIETLERFSETGEDAGCDAKGIEIRTTIHPTIQGAVSELRESFTRLYSLALAHGFTPVLISFNPYRSKYAPNPPFNPYEMNYFNVNPDDLADIYLLSYGPDMNISVADVSSVQLIDIGQKLTYYSPFIVPFSFSSPFYEGNVWDGLSVRTYLRTGRRAATYVFLEHAHELIPSNPQLTRLARLPAEVGRIEFKAFDSCADFRLYAAFLALLKGLIRDQQLHGRALIPDRSLHQLAAQRGFAAPEIHATAAAVLAAADAALDGDADHEYLQPLHAILADRQVAAHQLCADFRATGSITAALRATYAGYAPNDLT